MGGVGWGGVGWWVSVSEMGGKGSYDWGVKRELVNDSTVLSSGECEEDSSGLLQTAITSPHTLSPYHHPATLTPDT